MPRMFPLDLVQKMTGADEEVFLYVIQEGYRYLGPYFLVISLSSRHQVLVMS